MKRWMILGIGILCGACASFEPRSGDLVFQAGPGSGFERAVADATSGKGGVAFTHVGVAEKTKEGVFVWEASPDGGVRRTPLKAFLAEAAVWNGNPAAEVFRLRRAKRRQIPGALARIRAWEGRPYDFLFARGEDAFYCSELVQAAFAGGEGGGLFPSAPMNFKDLKTGGPSAYWQAYFAARGVPVPQGEPGTNPGDLSKSVHLRRVHRYF